jgi:hypothetical protein
MHTDDGTGTWGERTMGRPSADDPGLGMDANPKHIFAALFFSGHHFAVRTGSDAG